MFNPQYVSTYDEELKRAKNDKDINAFRAVGIIVVKLYLISLIFQTI
jgi:hypothetical protein